MPGAGGLLAGGGEGGPTTTRNEWRAQEPLGRGGAAPRTGRVFVEANQRLEIVMALLALVIVKRHRHLPFSGSGLVVEGAAPVKIDQKGHFVPAQLIEVRFGDGAQPQLLPKGASRGKACTSASTWARTMGRFTRTHSGR